MHIVLIIVWNVNYSAVKEYQQKPYILSAVDITNRLKYHCNAQYIKALQSVLVLWISLGIWIPSFLKCSAGI